MAEAVPHEYGPSRVGHGEAQCKWCLGTNRENAIIALNHCDERAGRDPAFNGTAGGHEIPFTRYLLPDGRRQDTAIKVSVQAAERAAAIMAAGLAFECEVLRTGHVSLTITDPAEELDVDIRVVTNGPGVREAVEDLVLNFNLEGYKE